MDVRLLDAGPDAVPVGTWRCENCRKILPAGYAHQCPSRIDRAA